MSENKRQNNRYQVKDRAIAILNSAILFHIIDISKKGLSFRYIGKEKWLNNPGEIDIFFGENLCLEKLPTITVSDFALDGGFIPMRRHSVRFGVLTAFQQAQLDYFLLHYTNGKS